MLITMQTQASCGFAWVVEPRLLRDVFPKGHQQLLTFEYWSPLFVLLLCWLGDSAHANHERGAWFHLGPGTQASWLGFPKGGPAAADLTTHQSCCCCSPRMELEQSSNGCNTLERLRFWSLLSPGGWMFQ